MIYELNSGEQRILLSNFSIYLDKKYTGVSIKGTRIDGSLTKVDKWTNHFSVNSYAKSKVSELVLTDEEKELDGLASRFLIDLEHSLEVVAHGRILTVQIKQDRVKSSLLELLSFVKGIK